MSNNKRRATDLLDKVRICRHNTKIRFMTYAENSLFILRLP